MTSLLLSSALISGFVSLCWLLGWAVLSLCDGAERPVTVAPVVGAGALVLWLSALSVLVAPGSPIGVLLTGVALGATVIVAVVRGRRRRPSGTGWRLAAGTAAIGVVCIVPFLGVMTSADSMSVVHLSSNHDAFFFTAVPQWLTEQRSTVHPGLTPDSELAAEGGTGLLGSVWDYYQLGSLRFGSDALASVVSTATGLDPLRAWLPYTLALHVVFVLAVQQFAARMGRPGWWSVVVAAVVGTSTLAISEVIDQHTPTILALALVLALVAEVAEATSAPEARRSPLVVALLLASVAATYGEALALFGLPLALLVAVRSFRARSFQWRYWGTAAVASALLGALPWWRSLGGVSSSAPPPGYLSSFSLELGWYSVVRNLGVRGERTSLDWSAATVSGRVGVLTFFAVLVVGLAWVSVRGIERIWWSSLLGVGVLGWFALGRVDTSGYPQQRWVEWLVPIVVLGSLLGWIALCDRVWSVRGPRWVAVTTVLGVVLLAVPGLLNLVRLDDRPDRRIDGSYVEVAEWLRQRDPSGGDTVVWAEDYLANLWSPYLLRSSPGTSYLSIYRDYHQIDHFGPMAGRRWLVLDAAAATTSSFHGEAVAASNERFTLLDLTVGPVELTVPPSFEGRWSAGGETVRVVLVDGSIACSTPNELLECR